MKQATEIKSVRVGKLSFYKGEDKQLKHIPFESINRAKKESRMLPAGTVRAFAPRGASIGEVMELLGVKA